MHDFDDFRNIIKQSNYENITFNYLPDLDLFAVISIHSTARGPAIGGTRCIPYTSTKAAIYDSLALSKAMSYKSAIHELPHGGAKAVIMKPEKIENREKFFQEYGKLVDNLNGRYLTSVDSGTSIDDLNIIKQVTPYVLGFDDPSIHTARGVMRAIEAAALFKLNKSLSSTTIAIKGLGHVGHELCRLLSIAGANLIISDCDQIKAEKTAKEFDATLCNNDEILSTKCDILAPCALGGDINAESIQKLNTSIICGAANNQLANDEIALSLNSLGILYLPDYLVNAGGLHFVAACHANDVEATMDKRIDSITSKVNLVLEKAEDQSKCPLEICNKLAKDYIYNQ